MNILKKIIFIIFVFCTAHFSAFAQGISISGTITDDMDEPLPGVNVVVKGTTIGIPSNANGTYQITVPNAESVLRFSYLGYTTVEIVVGSQRIINVKMREDAANLEEVVVIAYGTQKSKSVTSSIVSLQTEELLKSPTTSLGNALAGRLPGLAAIQYSGLPGYDDPTIYIRGVSTTGNSSPLILVDGVERPFTQIDPNEVADISILKDAGATAVFGVRGANGVILVTTKRGEAGKARVSVSASYGLQQPTKIVEFADSYLYATTYNNAQLGDGLDPSLVVFDDKDIEHYRLRDQPILYPSIDWMTYIMEKYAARDQINVNVTGGNDRARYFVSVSRVFEDGLFKTFASDPRENFRYTRYNYRANLDIDLSKTTLFSMTLGGRIEDRNSIGGGDGESGNARESTIFRYLMEAPPMSGAGIIDGKHITFNKEITPLYIIRDGLSTFYANGFRNDVTSVLNFDIELKQKLDMITKGLDFTIIGSYNNRFNMDKRRLNNGMGVSTYYPRPVYGPDDKIIGVNLEKMNDSQVKGYEERFSFNRDWEIKAKFNYQRRFADIHNLAALLLYTQSKNYYPGSYSDVPIGYVGLVARVTYDYKTKYLFDLNMGYNGSENFAKGKRYGFFPAGSVGWLITEEDFMKDQIFLNHLKLRYSLGLVGNDKGMGRFIYLPSVYTQGRPRFLDGIDLGNHSYVNSGYLFGGYTNSNGYKPTLREGNIGNKDVTWEKSRKQNIGLDIKTLNNRFGVNFDYFWEHRWDILTSSSARIPSHFALPNNPVINFNAVNNWGYELALSWSDKIGKDFKYTIAPNMAFTRNKKVKYLEVKPNESYMSQIGLRVGQRLGYEFYGFYHEGIETEYLNYMKSRPEYEEWLKKQKPDEKGNMPQYTFPKHKVNLKKGDCVYLDLNYDGLIDSDDQHPIGNTIYPEYTFGLNMSFKYKRFEFSMLWIGATNTDRSLEGYMDPFGSQNNGALVRYLAENSCSWDKDADNSQAMFPRITFSNKSNNKDCFSSIYYVDASYARLKNLEIRYNFNASKIPYINNLSVFFTGYNLLTFSKYKANDPETTGGGFNDWYRYPPTRVFNLGFNLGF